MTHIRSKEITFTLAGHAHLDPVWLWDRQEGIEAVKATFRSALDRLQENPDLVFVHSSAAQYALMETHPTLMGEIRAAAERGQWEPVGGFWVEPDVNIPSGEALARQGLLGQRYFQRTLGCRSRVAFLPDSFGHPYTLPQIFKQCGMDYFLFWRPIGPEINLPSNLFTWEGPDGTRMLSARVESYNSNPNNVIDTLNASIGWRPADAPEWIVVYGVGNHGGGPTKKAIASMRELNQSPDWPTLAFGSIEGFFERAKGRKHPSFNEPLQYSYRGCYTSHSQMKKLNRRGENLLASAEKWSAIAAQYGLPYPQAALTRAWEHLCFNQFHDIICGTSIPRAYDDVRDELGEAIGTARRTAYDALQKIAQQIDTRSGEHEIGETMRRVRTGPGNAVADLGDGIPVIFFNPSPWPRREVVDVEVNDWHISEMQVQDDAGYPVVHQFVEADAKPPRKRAAFLAEVPAMGYRLYRIVDRPAAQLPGDAPLLSATERILENRWWRLELDERTGAIRSLKDKERNLELMAGGGAQLLVIEDPTNPWGQGDYFRHLAGVFGDPTFTLLEAGPVRATVQVEVSWGASVARQSLTIYRETPAIEGKLEIDWHEEYRMVKLAFPFALEEAKATFSVPFGHIERPAGGQEEPSQQWLDVTGRPAARRQGAGPNFAQLGEAGGGEQTAAEGAEGGAGDGAVARDAGLYGVALINDCKYGADVMGGEARLSILRSPIYGNGNRGATPVRPTDRYLDQGVQEVRWALVPHAGPWQAAPVVQAAQDLNEPMVFVREYAHAGDLPKRHSFLTIEPPDAVIVSALKQAEEGDDLVLRVYEHRGRQATARVRLPLAKADFQLEARPHQIKSYRIAPDGTVREVNMLEE
ncbi:MAG: putative alpha-mannosidase [Symbiobacteriaceae bacterium]|jgi:alpha-mannosidase|nr:putative alpha-mannosidase [Symbiobacteriaceae bacterium]